MLGRKLEDLRLLILWTQEHQQREGRKMYYIMAHNLFALCKIRDGFDVPESCCLLLSRRRKLAKLPYLLSRLILEIIIGPMIYFVIFYLLFSLRD